MRIQRSFSFESATFLSGFILGSRFRIRVFFISPPGLVGNSVLITIGKSRKGTEINNSNVNSKTNQFRIGKMFSFVTKENKIKLLTPKREVQSIINSDQLI